MYKGGTAGGGKKKDVLEVTKPVPKFLQQFKYQAPEEEEEKVTIDSKFQTNDPKEDEDDEYDVENAQVLDENGNPIKKEGEETEEKDERVYDHPPELNKKVDIATFHPTFKTKKAPGKEGEEQKVKEEKEKEVKKNKDEGEKGKSKDDINAKRGLDKYINSFLKEEKDKNEPKVNKKIKSSLLSFGDDE